MATEGSVRASTGKKNPWTLNFTGRQSNSKGELPSPPGYLPFAAQLHAEDRKETVDPALVAKRSWDIALGPAKQIPMNLFIMYMAGNSISIFPIMMVGMLFLRPIQALFKVSATFKMIEGDGAILMKLVYLLGNAGCILLAVYKCHSMGLLPTHPSDWLEFLSPPERLEFAGGGVIL